ncbi:futalosine hydrolase [Streptomyces sp. WMMC940]|uniref:futalosine hydrolase n=1 Tax=Streptomyces sp. WMMC940 TaxID=3015153 RepID=UPI0022B6DEC2|nr:futalosine hydrolase [Streptomyces sp. WMMC940]MCZ7459555.1 futalosine hydrolase [Streptomyces sp. WMMC940]
MRVLVVTAVRAEADSAAAGLAPGGPVTAHRIPGGHTLHRCAGAGTTVDVMAGGVGPAAAAAATATALTAATAAAPGAPAYDLVVSAGIGGGFAGIAPPVTLVVADAIVAADLGAQTPDGHLPVEELGFGRSVHPPAALSERIAEALGAVHGPVLTVSTVTGTADRAAELTARHPRAAVEAMEGFGVAEAAATHGVPVVEIRAVSNAVGPRDRAAWRIGEALDALRNAFRLLRPVLEEEAR